MQAFLNAHVNCVRGKFLIVSAKNKIKWWVKSMFQSVKRAWTEMVQPILQRPKRFQVAAMCYRQVKDQTEILLITSRDTGRWILPKGWPINGLDAANSALQEAWEEAGVKSGIVEGPAIGSYDYDKVMDGGRTLPIEAHVFKVRVDDLTDTYPECGKRKRKWVRPAEAATLVNEPQLKAILSTCA